MDGTGTMGRGVKAWREEMVDVSVRSGEKLKDICQLAN